MYVVEPWKHDRRFDETSSKTEFVPCRHHATSVIQVMILLRGERDLERTIARRDRRGVVPLDVVRLPVVEVDRLPVRVVAGVERPPLDVELVAEHELPLFARHEVRERVSLRGRVGVDDAPVARYRRNLPRGVDSAEVEATLGCQRLPEQGGDDWIPAAVRTGMR